MITLILAIPAAAALTALASLEERDQAWILGSTCAAVILAAIFVPVLNNL